jgi:hypothetical protein
MNYFTRLLEIIISMKFFIRKNEKKYKIFQHFIFNKGKDSHFLFDPRYLIYDKFEQKIRNNMLELEFLRRRNEKDRVVIEYVADKDYIKVKNNIFIVAEFVPPNPGCIYCIHKGKELENGFFECLIKQKIIAQEIDKCQVFKQKNYEI